MFRTGRQFSPGRPWSDRAGFEKCFASGLIDVPVRRAATPRHGLGARRTLIGLAAFVAVVLGVGPATGLSLNAAGVPYPGTIAGAVAGVLFAVVGPMLVRWEADTPTRRSRSRG